MKKILFTLIGLMAALVSFGQLTYNRTTNTLIIQGDVASKLSLRGNTGTITLQTQETATGTLYFPSVTGSATLMVNPMTSQGDLIYGGASGVPTRLARGTDGYVLTLSGGVPIWATPPAGGNGGSMTWPINEGIPIYSGSHSWSASIADNSTYWNTAYSWGDHSLAGYINSITATSIAEGVLDNAIDDAIIGVAAEDVLGGSTGRDRYMSPQQIYDYVSQHGGGGGGSFQGQIKEFTVDDVGGPQEGMLAYTNPDFAGYQVWTLRDGVRDNKCIQAGSTITADLEWQEDEGITFLLWPHGTWEDISSEQEVLNSIKDKLTVYYKLDENTGTTATDEMGSINGSLYGDAAWVTGKINTGIYSETILDYIRVSNNAAMQMNGDPFSVSIWVNFEELVTEQEDPTTSVVWSYYYPEPIWIATQLNIGSNGTVTFTCRNNEIEPAPHVCYGNTPQTKNEWIHYVCVNRGNGYPLEIWRNGVLDVDHCSPPTFSGEVLNTSSFMYIGHHGGSLAHVPKTVDEFMLFRGALSQEEIEALWGEGDGIQLMID